MSDRRTIVVGGGVIGICAAYFLSRRGAAVTVLERDRIAGAASFGNAGSIAPGHAPINRPGRLAQALRWMFAPTSPLYVAPRLDPSLCRWLWDFNRHNTRSHVSSCMELLGPLGHETQRLFDEIVEEEDLDCDYRRQGYYEVFATAQGLAEATRDAERLRRHGYGPRILTGDELRERDPAFSADVRGAVWHEEASACNPHRFVTELARCARRRGAELREGCAVERLVAEGDIVRGVRTTDGETLPGETVLLATGAYSGRLLRDLGVRVPLQAAKGYHRDFGRDLGALDGGALAPRVSCLLGESFIFCNPIDDFVRFAGTLEFSGVNHRIRPSRVEQLTAGTRAYFREVPGCAPRSEWCGLRPCLPDGLPVIGPIPGHPGLFVANGHAMMGLTLGPVTGRIVADMVLDGHVPAALRPLRVDRF